MRTMMIVLFVTIVVAAGAYAQHSHNQATNKDTTLVGEVIDPVCYLSHSSIGKQHKQCAEYCVKQGITLGLLEEKTKQVYISLPVDHSNPNAKLKDFIAEKVKVTGTIYSKGGLKGIHVKTIERVGQ